MSKRSFYGSAPLLQCLGGEIEKLRVRPLADLVEAENGLYLYCTVAGLALEDLRLEADAESLYLRGETNLGCLPGKVQALEFGDVIFEARYPLPCSVDGDNIEASLLDGVLSVFLPFPTVSPTHRVPVEQG